MPTYKPWNVQAFKLKNGSRLQATQFTSTVIANNYNPYYGPVQAIWDLFTGLSLAAFDMSMLGSLPDDDQSYLIYTLDNDIKIYGRHNGNYVGAYLSFPDGNEWYFIAGDDQYQPYQLREHMYFFLMHGYNGDTYINNDIKMVLIYIDSAHPDIGYFLAHDWTLTPLSGKTKEDYYNLLLENDVPLIEFQPFEHLTGNDGQFNMDLSQINASIIGDGETQRSDSNPHNFVIVPRTSLYNLSVNMLDNQEYTIAYCGDNYLNMIKRTVVGDQSTVIYVKLKFYFRSDVLIYTSDEMQIIRQGTSFPNDYYLSIIYDPDNEVAALDCINNFSNIFYYNNFALPSSEQMRALYIWLQDNGNAQSSDPYGTGSTDDGGDPEGTRQQDNITDSPLPTCGGLELGFVTLYRPTDAQLGQIASFLWSDNVLDNFKKYFNNFADNILSLYALPFTPSGLQTKTFKVGNLTSEITGVEYCTVRYFDIDMGQLEVKNQWGSYLDYSPYTKMEIYLPYLGLHSLDADEIMSPARMDGSMPDKQGTVLSLVYRLDILTGIIVAKIKVRVYKKNGTYTDEIRYQFSGRVGSICPLTGQTYSGYIQTAAVEFTGLVSTIASGGLAAPMAGAAAVTATVAAQKPTVERVGAVSGDASMMATNVPYLCISVPNKSYLDSQQKFTGFPSYKSGLLSNFSGFTQVIEAHVEGISCTEEERTKILAYLKEGVIL